MDISWMHIDLKHWSIGQKQSFDIYVVRPNLYGI